MFEVKTEKIIIGVENDLLFSLAAAPDSGSICLAGCQSGLYRSVNGGRNWSLESNVPTQNESAPVTAVGIDVKRSQLYAAVPGTVLNFQNGSVRWEQHHLRKPAPIVSSFAIPASTGACGIAFAGTLEDGIYRSEDSGRTWQPASVGLYDMSVLTLAASPAFAEDGVAFAGTETGVFVSTNWGKSWRDTGIARNMAPITALAVSPGFPDDATIFAGTEGNGVWRSQDGGRTWEQIVGTTGDLTFHSVLTLDSGTIILASNRHLLASKDQGTTCEPVGGEFDVHADAVSAIAVERDNRHDVLVGFSDTRLMRFSATG